MSCRTQGVISCPLKLCGKENGINLGQIEERVVTRVDHAGLKGKRGQKRANVDNWEKYH